MNFKEEIKMLAIAAVGMIAVINLCALSIYFWLKVLP